MSWTLSCGGGAGRAWDLYCGGLSPKLSSEEPELPQPGEKAPLSPVLLLVAVTSEEHSRGAVPYACSLTPATGTAVSLGRHLHVRAYSCSEQMGSFRKDEQLAAFGHISRSHLVCTQKMHFRPRSDPLHRTQSIPLPSCSQLAGEDRPTSKSHTGSRREPS